MKGAVGLLTGLADVAVQAYRAADPRRMGVEVGMGADGTPTKEIDAVVERALLEALEKAGTGWNVLSEEAGWLDRGAEWTLVMDPIDGTTNAARNVPFHCVSLALCRQKMSDCSAALVRNIPTGETFTATPGGGAFVDGRRLPEIGRQDEILVSVNLWPGAEAQLPTEGRHLYVRSFGAAALETCLVASGALDAYVQRQPTLRVTDLAAAALVLKEAGGQLLDASGRPLDMPVSLNPRTGLISIRDLSLLPNLGVRL